MYRVVERLAMEAMRNWQNTFRLCLLIAVVAAAAVAFTALK
jgi:hypothetical protein